MLETVLEIGRVFRQSSDNLKHHRYIKPCPQDNKQFKILRLSIPVKEDFSFDFDNISEIINENIIKDKLYYFTFKTSDADGLVKYIFGDIYYKLEKGKEYGSYRRADKTNKQKAYRSSSFDRGEKDFQSIKELNGWDSNNNIMEKFRIEFKKNQKKIENLLFYLCGIKKYFASKHTNNRKLQELLLDKQELKLLTAEYVFEMIQQSNQSKKQFNSILKNKNPNWDNIKKDNNLINQLINYSTGAIFIHFDFGGKHWYEFDKDMEKINEKLLEDFTEKVERGYVLKKYIYKTLSSPKEDWQFPNFSPKNRYCNKLFETQDEILDLLYAIDYSEKTLIEIPKTDIKIIVLPRGENLSFEDYAEFNSKVVSLQEEQKREELTVQKNVKISDDLLFELIFKSSADKLVKFDFIFSKRGGQKSPDVDLIELSGIERTHLKQIYDRIKNIKEELCSKFNSETIRGLKITESFLNILENTVSDKKKYESHLYKVLPKIYTGTYYQDPILLPAFIKKVEYNIRNEAASNLNSQVWQLKHYFYFLIYIQNTEKEGENLMKIQETRSYKIGYLLGQLARQFVAWREDCPMKSFEKSYVGTLSRRITNIQDLIKFKTFIEEKLIIHERSLFTHSISVELSEMLMKLEESNEKYDKNNCAFGFFESYFSKNKTEGGEK